jgi:hypothetical protein
MTLFYILFNCNIDVNSSSGNEVNIVYLNYRFSALSFLKNSINELYDSLFYIVIIY